MMSIEDVHRLLETTEDALSSLNQWDQEEIDDYNLGYFCSAVAEILEWSTAYSDTSIKLGVAANILTRYAKHRGPFKVREARMVAQRVRSFLKSQDQASEPPASSPLPPSSEAEDRNPRNAEQPSITFQAEGWVSVPNNAHIKQKILAVSVLLEGIIEQASRSNYPEDQRAISDIERAQLIAVLETVLALLKAPMVERAIIKKTDGMLARVARKVAEKKTEEGLGGLADMAREQLGNLIDMFWS